MPYVVTFFQYISKRVAQRKLRRNRAQPMYNVRGEIALANVRVFGALEWRRGCPFVASFAVQEDATAATTFTNHSRHKHRPCFAAFTKRASRGVLRIDIRYTFWLTPVMTTSRPTSLERSL